MIAAEGVRIEEWHPDGDCASDLEALADVLHAVVYDGAGVSFVVEAIGRWRPPAWDASTRPVRASISAQALASTGGGFSAAAAGAASARAASRIAASALTAV